MIVAIICIIISFMCDMFFSNVMSYTITNPSCFTTIFTIIGLVSIYPYFNSQRKYLILLIITALLFDIVYTSTFMFNVSIFLVIFFAVKFINFVLPHNIFIANLISFVSILIYHILSFIILTLIKYSIYDIGLLINIILHSIITSVIYTTFLYFVLKKIYEYIDVKQIR